MSTYRIILADDHILFRQGVKRILEEQDGIKVVGEAGDGIDLLKLLGRKTADMVIMDISMPGIRGIEATREIKSVHPQVRVLVLTMHRDMEYLQHAISAGASGFLLKEDADEALLSAIQTIQQGKVYISPLLRDEMTEYMFRGPLSGKKGDRHEKTGYDDRDPVINCPECVFVAADTQFDSDCR